MNNSLNYRFPLKILIFITYIRNRGMVAYLLAGLSCATGVQGSILILHVWSLCIQTVLGLFSPIKIGHLNIFIV